VTIDVDGPYGEGNYRAADDTYWLSQTAYDPRGTERLLGVLNDRGVAATFCWVGRAAEDRPLLLRSAAASGHEIALHSWDHRPYNRMTIDEQRADMERTQESLTRIAGSPAVGHKTASWRFNDDTARVAQQLGLLWIMDVPGGDLPYLVQPEANLPVIVQLPPSRWFDDYTVWVDQVLLPDQVFELWRTDLDVLRDEGGIMCLTLHPFVSGRPAHSRAVAWLLDYAIDLGDVWIDRADRVARWWLKERDDPRGSE
jgi:peptidoglycan/xylan/chitin deacetylase (PgdA/CDA1 family)